MIFIYRRKGALLPTEGAEAGLKVGGRAFQCLEDCKKLKVSDRTGAVLNKTKNVTGNIPSSSLQSADDFRLGKFLGFTQGTKRGAQQVPMSGWEFRQSDPRWHPAIYTGITLTVRLYMYYILKMTGVERTDSGNKEMNDGKNGIQPGSWRISVILWASGILTGVSYCSAVTAAYVEEENSKLVFAISASFLVLGCLVGCSFIVANWYQDKR